MLHCPCLSSWIFAIPQNQGVPCDDGLDTTFNDTCDGAGKCAGFDPCADVGCPALSQCHFPGQCVEGECVNTLRPNGWACDDGNAMSYFDVCVRGFCAGELTCNGSCIAWKNKVGRLFACMYVCVRVRACVFASKSHVKHPRASRLPPPNSLSNPTSRLVWWRRPRMVSAVRSLPTAGPLVLLPSKPSTHKRWFFFLCTLLP